MWSLQCHEQGGCSPPPLLLSMDRSACHAANKSRDNVTQLEAYMGWTHDVQSSHLHIWKICFITLNTLLSVCRDESESFRHSAWMLIFRFIYLFLFFCLFCLHHFPRQLTTSSNFCLRNYFKFLSGFTISFVVLHPPLFSKHLRFNGDRDDGGSQWMVVFWLQPVAFQGGKPALERRKEGTTGGVLGCGVLNWLGEEVNGVAEQDSK